MASAAMTETISATKPPAVSRAFTPVPAVPGLAAKAKGLKAPGVAKVVVATGPEAAAEDGDGGRQG
jgi:hypothetical protein